MRMFHSLLIISHSQAADLGRIGRVLRRRMNALLRAWYRCCRRWPLPSPPRCGLDQMFAW